MLPRAQAGAEARAQARSGAAKRAVALGGGEEAGGGEGGGVAAPSSALAALTHLRRLCSHPGARGPRVT